MFFSYLAQNCLVQAKSNVAANATGRKKKRCAAYCTGHKRDTANDGDVDDSGVNFIGNAERHILRLGHLAFDEGRVDAGNHQQHCGCSSAGQHCK